MAADARTATEGGGSRNGTVRATSDAYGNWAWVTQYKPFGQEYETYGSPANPKFAGQWRDSNTGLYHLYSRFYDPDLGRFLSPDPILGHLTVPSIPRSVRLHGEQPPPVRRPEGGVVVEPVRLDWKGAPGR